MSGRMHYKWRMFAAASVKELAAVALLVALFAIGPFVTASAADRPTSPSLSFDSSGWNVSDSPNFATRHPSMKALANFLNPLLESAGEVFPDIGESENDERHNRYVCSFTFKDLRHNGLLSLIVDLGVTGRQICGSVRIIDRTTQGFEIHGAGKENDEGSDISGSIKDLRGDGRLEYIEDDGWAQYDSSCWAMFPSIYGWTGRDYTNVSGQFKEFYRQRIESVKRRISAIEPFQYKGQWFYPGEKECLQAELALLERFLVISPEAGLDRAIRLAKSKYQVERYFAAQLLPIFKAPGFLKDSNDKLHFWGMVKPEVLGRQSKERELLQSGRRGMKEHGISFL